jgi:hypothetical protein
MKLLYVLLMAVWENTIYLHQCAGLVPQTALL